MKATESFMSLSPERAFARFREVRALSENLIEPLSPEDAMLSATEDTSPPKWHLAHTTWFFEKFLLQRFNPNYSPIDGRFDYFFNSYYRCFGSEFLPKRERGLISRPSLREILRYRYSIESRLQRLANALSNEELRQFFLRLETGIHHEQQHQELLLMDIKRNFYANPSRPAYRISENAGDRAQAIECGAWKEFSGGFTHIGAREDGAFAYDNERPWHRAWVEPFLLAENPVTNSEYLEFLDCDGYRKPRHWLSDGWDWIQSEGINAPLYWENIGGKWAQMTLYGMREIDPNGPLVHVSYYEADAYARWRGCRLPTEYEWEFASNYSDMAGQFLEAGVLHPSPAATHGGIAQMHGCVWEWTNSGHAPYPKYRPYDDELSEYNGKFLCNQFVLRGGSCVTPEGHYRPSYRNFFYPRMRWQFSGIRLAKDVP